MTAASAAEERARRAIVGAKRVAARVVDAARIDARELVVQKIVIAEQLLHFAERKPPPLSARIVKSTTSDDTASTQPLLMLNAIDVSDAVIIVDENDNDNDMQRLQSEL